MLSESNLRPIVKEHLATEAQVMTDDFTIYPFAVKGFTSHDVVNHSRKQYVRYEGERKIYTNTVEGFFSILKRGIVGVYHHVGKQHLHRYLNEFDSRYNSRDTSDGERALLAIKGTTGKRLMYRDSCGKA